MNNSSYKKKQSLYISIDFGNYKSGYAYSFADNKKKIFFGKMQDIPSVIILNRENLTAKNYGWKSLYSMDNYNEKEQSQIIFVNNLKLNLYNKRINHTIKEKYIISIEYYKKKSVSEYLRLISDDILEEINSLNKNKEENYSKNEVNWILSVPNIWDDFSKLNLLECGKEAGMTNIDLVIEPEAASLTFLEDSFIDSKFKQKGNVFMIIDFGEYICDITINEIIDDSLNIKKISYPLGNTFGSMNINNDIMDKIESVLGNDTIAKAKENQYKEYLQTLEDIESIKKKFKGDETNYFEIYAKFKRDSKKFQKKTKNFINWLTWGLFFKNDDKNNNNITFDDYKVYFPGLLIKEIIEKRVNEAINFVKKVKNKYNITYIILTGGYSNCKILVNEFKKKLNNTLISVLMNQEKSITKGAILYTFNKNKIQSRISHHKYEMEIFDVINFDDETCNEKITENNIKYCKKMETLIEKGEEIFYDQPFRRIITPIKSIDSININFYRANNNEKKGIYFGTLEINLSEFYVKEKKDIKLEMSIDFNTYFNINVSDLENNKKIKWKFHPKKI